MTTTAVAATTATAAASTARDARWVQRRLGEGEERKRGAGLAAGCRGEMSAEATKGEGGQWSEAGRSAVVSVQAGWLLRVLSVRVRACVRAYEERLRSSSSLMAVLLLVLQAWCARGFAKELTARGRLRATPAHGRIWLLGGGEREGGRRGERGEGERSGE